MGQRRRRRHFHHPLQRLRPSAADLRRLGGCQHCPDFVEQCLRQRHRLRRLYQHRKQSADLDLFHHRAGHLLHRRRTAAKHHLLRLGAHRMRQRLCRLQSRAALHHRPVVRHGVGPPALQCQPYGSSPHVALRYLLRLPVGRGTGHALRHNRPDADAAKHLHYNGQCLFHWPATRPRLQGLHSQHLPDWRRRRHSQCRMARLYDRVVQLGRGPDEQL